MESTYMTRQSELKRLAAAAASAQAPPRCRVLETAHSYTDIIWTPTSANIMHGLDPDGRLVNTTDNIAGGWIPGKPYKGMPYCWGGFDTPDSFLEAVQNGFPCGNVPLTPDQQLSLFGAGIDCSGFVDQCWELNYQFTTRDFPLLCEQVGNWSELSSGDIINLANHHVLLFVDFADIQKTQVIVCHAGMLVVEFTEFRISDLQALNYVPYRDWRRTSED